MCCVWGLGFRGINAERNHRAVGIQAFVSVTFFDVGAE